MVKMLSNDFNSILLETLLEDLISNNELDNHENPLVKIHFRNPHGMGEWWIVSGERINEEDWLLFGVCEIIEKEMGFVTLSQIQEYNGYFDLDYGADEKYLRLYDLI